MSFFKLITIVTLTLFGLIGAIALFKKPSQSQVITTLEPIEIPLEDNTTPIVSVIAEPKASAPALPTAPVATAPLLEEKKEIPVVINQEADRIEELFNTNGNKLPIVETLTYKSKVSWQQGRPAWLSDYARHYRTSRHFIARSLNGKRDYFKQDIADGARFNVLKRDKNLQFTLLADLSNCKMSLFCEDLDEKKKYFLKAYPICVGREDEGKVSGSLTPLGKYTLGSKTAIYNQKSKGTYRGEQIDMITVFGTRWIPFDKELEPSSEQTKGLGIHGLPWVSSGSGKKHEDRSSLGKHQSDGCIRLASEDMEEIFAIIITRPAVIELVKGGD